MSINEPLPIRSTSIALYAASQFIALACCSLRSHNSGSNRGVAPSSLREIGQQWVCCTERLAYLNLTRCCSVSCPDMFGAADDDSGASWETEVRSNCGIVFGVSPTLGVTVAPVCVGTKVFGVTSSRVAVVDTGRPGSDMPDGKRVCAIDVVTGQEVACLAEDHVQRKYVCNSQWVVAWSPIGSIDIWKVVRSVPCDRHTVPFEVGSDVRFFGLTSGNSAIGSGNELSILTSHVFLQIDIEEAFNVNSTEREWPRARYELTLGFSIDPGPPEVSVTKSKEGTGNPELYLIQCGGGTMCHANTGHSKCVGWGHRVHFVDDNHLSLSQWTPESTSVNIKVIDSPCDYDNGPCCAQFASPGTMHEIMVYDALAGTHLLTLTIEGQITSLDLWR
ncbi:hypothetical protein Pelo_7771 [Pelomyxa schiedti]|nr:hypothetical protein Pelo_7771 [Pelomyxa schiedti]